MEVECPSWLALFSLGRYCQYAKFIHHWMLCYCCNLAIILLLNCLVHIENSSHDPPVFFRFPNTSNSMVFCTLTKYHSDQIPFGTVSCLVERTRWKCFSLPRLLVVVFTGNSFIIIITNWIVLSCFHHSDLFLLVLFYCCKPPYAGCKRWQTEFPNK